MPVFFPGLDQPPLVEIDDQNAIQYPPAHFAHQDESLMAALDEFLADNPVEDDVELDDLFLAENLVENDVELNDIIPGVFQDL